ncbi:hypothetical protein LMH73_020240 [Vibrio splendidus]|nr:hypothetical protein [Vibrio splendidus]MCC4881883.1 hypothetical protein [Vibrio splendidus]
MRKQAEVKQLTLGELKELVAKYVGLKEVGHEIAESISQQISSKPPTDDSKLINAYEANVNAIFNSQGDEYDCFLIDNQLNLMFASSDMLHVSLRAHLVSLYVLKNWMVPKENADMLLYGFGDPYKLADIYTGLCLGIYESARWGGRSIVYSSEYEFAKFKQTRLSTCHNLSPVEYTHKQALADLTAMIAE